MSVPPQVLAEYQSVMGQAQQTAQTPFQTYNGEFVAPINAEQSQGIAATNTAATEAQPYYQAATGTLGSAQAATTPVNTAAEIGTAEAAAPISGADINQYLSPYLGDVLESTEAVQNQENQQQQAGQLGNAITSGAFGSDRTGIAAANLEEQQNLANNATIANIANTGYTTAQGEANTEQQAALQGANQLASIGSTAYGEAANTANELGTLGTGAQTAGLAGASAQLAAGTVQQQTQQAEDTALYNQFLQQQSYPFQVDQFLAGIAEGTGSLSGSTTTTTQPGGLLIATGGAVKGANDDEYYKGGVVPFRRKRDTGGGLAGVLQAQQQMYAGLGAGGQRQIPTSGNTAHSLAVAQPPPAQPSTLSQLNGVVGLANSGNQLYRNLTAPSGGVAGGASMEANPNYGLVGADSSGLGYFAPGAGPQNRGGRAGLGRTAFDAGGTPYAPADDELDIPNTQTNATLRAVQPPKPQPSALQQASGIAGLANGLVNLFSRGGLAGRRGYDDGGDITDDDTPQTVTVPVGDASVTATGPAPGVAGSSTPSTTPGGLGGTASKPSLWSRFTGELEKPSTLALLEGLGAAATAPTIHPGVALAAGLEAGARAYPELQQGLANAALTRAQVPGQQAASQIAGLRAGVAQNAFAPTPGGVVPRQPVAAPPTPAPAAPISTQAPPAATSPVRTYPLPSNVARPVPAPTSAASSVPAPAAPAANDAAATAAGLAAQYRAQFFVNTARTPEEQAQKDAAIKKDWAVGGTMFEQQADTDYQARVQRDQQNNRNAAQQEADAQYAAYQAAPPGSPAAQTALARYQALRQWTGDGTEIQGGIVKNSRTNLPEIGSIAQQGLTPEQAANIQIQEGMPVDTGAPARMPLATWARTQGVTLPPAVAGAQPSAPSTAATAAPQPARPMNPASASSVRGAGAAPASKGNVPDFSSAPAAPAWAHNPSVVAPSGQDPKAYADIENGLIAESGRLQETQADVIKTQRMLNLLPSAKTGPGSDMMSMTQTVLGNLTGSQFVSWLNSNPGAYAILQKSLGQQALDSRLQEMKAGGASVRLGAMQDNLILNKLSASPEMPKSAISGILNWQLQQDNWDLGRETAIPQYLAQGRDARYFDAVYPKQNPLAQSLTVGAPAGTTVPPAGGKPDASGFIVGKLYRDKNGKTAVYGGNGKWQ